MKGGGFNKRTVRDVPLSGKTVLVRADYNVPLNPDGTIADDFRIRAGIPTLQYLLDHQCKIVVCSHLGRPDGKADERLSLELVGERLAALVGRPVKFVPDSVGDQVVQAVKKLRSGEIALLENLRFYPEEEANDDTFGRSLAADTGADYFVQDGFGVVHRAHASTSAITRYVPSVAGLLLERECRMIRSSMADPKRPLVAVLGGAKISDKIAVIEAFVRVADTVVIGGALANTFLKYHGHEIGKSVYEKDVDGIIEKIYAAAEKKVGADHLDEFLVLPSDVAVASEIDSAARRVTVSLDDVTGDEYILDIGPETIARVTERLKGAGTVVWNGTLGYAELEQFSYGSARVALTLASQPGTVSVIGGGDTADFVLGWDGAGGKSFSHVSTGGGASLDLMAGAPMPGIEALLDA